MRLLKTKLFAPRNHAEVIEREKLLSLLNKSKASIIMVTATAGFGKSTLISQWLQREDVAYSWYSLDESDSDSFHFISYVVGALSSVEEGIGKELLRQWETSFLGEPLSVEEVFIELLNEITLSEKEITLVLDDYHLITESEIHKNLLYWFEHMPPNLRIIIISREKPPFPLARLRSHKQLLEIDESLLSFSFEESEKLYNNLLSFTLSNEELAKLYTTTEGWIAGLQLCAISLQDQRASDHVIETFSGNHKHVAEYLFEEVLERLPKDLYHFLLTTTLLSRFNGELCNTLLKNSKGDAFIKELDKRHIFLISLDSQNQWFRYHHLLTSALSERLSKEQRRSIYHTAALWFQSNGYYEEAFYYACEGEFFDLAAQIFEQIDFISWSNGTTPHSYNLLMQFPKHYCNSNPLLLIHMARELHTMMKYDEALSVIKRADELLSSWEESAEKNRFMGRLSAIATSIGFSTGDLVVVAKYNKKAIELLTLDGDLYWLAIALMVEGGMAVLMGEGDVYRAVKCYERTMRVAEEHGNILLIGVTYSFSMNALGLMGKIQLIKEKMKYLETLLDRNNGVEVPVSLISRQEILGETAVAEGKIEEALSIFEEGLTAIEGKWIRKVQVLHRIEIWAALASLVVGDYSKQHFIENLLQESNLPIWIQPLAFSYLGRVPILQKKREAVEQWLASSGVCDDSLFLAYDAPKYPVYGAGLLFLEEFQRAESFLHRLQKQLYKTGNRYNGLEAHLLYCVSIDNLQKRELYKEEVTALCNLSFELGLFRHFCFWLDMSIPMITKALEERWYSGGAATFTKAHLETLLAKLSHLRQKRDGSLADTLSDREIEVLQYVAEGKSNKEIADILFVSLNTVKTHMKKIHAKLDVKNRVEAVVRGRELFLIA